MRNAVAGREFSGSECKSTMLDNAEFLEMIYKPSEKADLRRFGFNSVAMISIWGVNTQDCYKFDQIPLVRIKVKLSPERKAGRRVKAGHTAKVLSDMGMMSSRERRWILSRCEEAARRRLYQITRWVGWSCKLST